MSGDEDLDGTEPAAPGAGEPAPPGETVTPLEPAALTPATLGDRFTDPAPDDPVPPHHHLPPLPHLHGDQLAPDEIHGQNPDVAGEPAAEKHWLKPPVTTEVALTATVLFLVAANYLMHRVAWIANAPDLTVAIPFVAILSLIAWWSGHGLEEVGLARRTWRVGVAWSTLLIIVIGIVYLAAALFPATRGLFTDARYASLSFTEVMLRAFVYVPFATVLPEELAFRGVLYGLALRKWPVLAATAFAASLFGLWHVLTSLHLDSQKPALTNLLGHSTWSAVLADLGAVVFTGLSGAVFCELRRRTRSLLVPMSLHWATNALGYLVGFLVRVHGL